MVEPLTADDILPLVAGLTPEERVRFIRLITAQPDADDGTVYSAVPPKKDEFSSADEALTWEGDGWEEID